MNNHITFAVREQTSYDARLIPLGKHILENDRYIDQIYKL